MMHGCLLIVMILLMPIWVPIFGIMDFFDRPRKQAVLRRKQAIAAEFPCSVCGELLGVAALELAVTEHQRRFDELRRNNPGVIFRVIRHYDAICTHCRAEFRYLEEEGRFVQYLAPERAVQQPA